MITINIINLQKVYSNVWGKIRPITYARNRGAFLILVCEEIPILFNDDFYYVKIYAKN
jgi:hypothetical protein